MANQPLPLSTTSLPAQPIQFSHQISTILNANNYLHWKSQILPVLQGHGLISYIDASVAPPPAMITNESGSTINPAFVHWQKQDQLILAWMINSLSPPLLSQVLTCETTDEVWNTIQQNYNSQSVAKMLELKLKLQTIRKGSDTCAQYLHKFQEIADRLKTIGFDVIEKDLVLLALQGLGSDYESFVTVISMRPGPLSMAELQSFLLAHEARLFTNQQVLIGSQQLNISTQFTSTNAIGTGTSQENQIHVAHHNTTGPKPYYNFNKKNSNRGRGRVRNNNPSTREVQCQICTKWGHSALKCCHRFDLAFNASGVLTTQPPTSQPSSTQHQALVAEPSTSPPSQAWFLDSSATTHVTPDINCLTTYQTYNGPDQVFLV